MVVWAIEQHRAHPQQPAFLRQRTTLRAAPMFTGVIPDPLDVAVRATLNMGTERASTAKLESRDGFKLWQRSAVLCPVGGKVVG